LLRYITNIGQLALPRYSASGLPFDPIELLRNVWIEFEGGEVLRIGAEGEPTPQVASDDGCYDARGGLVTPGLIDCHTHPAFAGFRQNEFVLRCQGKGYLEIAACGGGILSSVRGVRSISLGDLTILVRERFERFLELGVTSLEAKSGYGLSLDDEIKSLTAIRDAAGDSFEVSPTLLGAHTVPPEQRGNADRYVDIVCREMIPAAVEAGLALSVDVFVEETAFSVSQARRVFAAGKDAGLKLRIHANQFSSSGAAGLAAEFGALTADHMDIASPDELRLLAEAGVTLVLLPGAVFFLGLEKYAPARAMIEAGCRIALSTDFNPGTSPTTSLPLMMTLGCNRLKLTPAEALWAVTVGAACAIGREDRIGRLAPGFQADVCVWDMPDVESLPYRYGDQVPVAVFKRGCLVAERGQLVTGAYSSR